MALIETSTVGHVGYITLNRPQALNALNEEMDQLLGAAWDKFETESGIWVIVLRANGERAFCAGGDMHAPPTGSSGLSFGGGITGIGGRLRPISKPVICATHGHVLGLGFEIAMCADIIVAATTSRFAFPEARAGIIEHCGVVHRAVRQLPHHVAMAMILASEPLDAVQAAQYGLVNEVVAPDCIEQATARWAEKLLACSPLAARAAKEAALAGLEGSLPEALSRTYPGISRYADSGDRTEAIGAWSERRNPHWTGM
ncbi:enoyl-CoA hydratase/isomerase family protein [Novosphingobium sp. ES2-1]|uniref:enoyl-CoA hydratase/isomerase family protein n=1 Tax=Novosphingobium sp. ES2-1 TaxID=2780074 RepID=UPI0018825CEE|nr:enoyl-CoA hydratase-related protein [Novosphingobium sp. ES2-1]QOV96151.1 enoyl-CoA hydratase/isomerase family protein [Novosphingobium sp. ES2-1]